MPLSFGLSITRGIQNINNIWNKRCVFARDAVAIIIIIIIITPVVSVTWPFRNHSRMVIWISRNSYDYYQLKAVALLGNRDTFFSLGFFDEQKDQKNSIYLKRKSSVHLNVSLMNKLIFLQYFCMNSFYFLFLTYCLCIADIFTCLYILSTACLNCGKRFSIGSNVIIIMGNLLCLLACFWRCVLDGWDSDEGYAFSGADWSEPDAWKLLNTMTD